jgi:hypothetical protein
MTLYPLENPALLIYSKIGKISIFLITILDPNPPLNPRKKNLVQRYRGWCQEYLVQAEISLRTMPLTFGHFGDSMSAAARAKRWGVFRQAKGQEFEQFTLLT